MHRYATLWRRICSGKRYDGRPFFYGGGDNQLVAAEVDAMVNQWLHLSVTWDGTTIRFYVNSQLIDSSDISIDFSNLDIRIGGDEDKDGSNSYWRGRIDDIRIYSRTLSAEEIQGLFDLR